LNATKSSGNIANFNLYICKSDGTNYSQVGYVGHDLTSNKAVAMTSVFNATVGSNTVGARSSISGAVSKAGAWTSKTIQSITSTTLSSGTFDSKSTITQSSDKLEIDSFQKGTYSSTAFTNRVHAIMELLGGDTLINFAVGDGSARYVLSGLASLDNTTSWTGDDKAPLGTASNGTYYSSVAGTTPKATETVSTAFSEAETWDCAAGTGGSFSEIAITTSLSTGLIEDFAACVTNFPDPVDTFVDCAGTLDN
ncbi:MAG: hypothetical protein HYR96_14745, partial [Deltaproteobacteria bacterium]|nr:hypothetical protein [Deltaproteobacteria bacterium]